MHLCDIWAAHPMITMLIYECLSAAKSKAIMVTIEDYSVRSRPPSLDYWHEMIGMKGFFFPGIATGGVTGPLGAYVCSVDSLASI